MKASGILMVIIGAWVVAQVTMGGGLQRIGILSDTEVAVNVDPKTGIPNQDPSLPLLRDQNGRPY